ncbi:MAG: 3-phosphoshikimate 1-carboxyvinyltransferase [Saprospiraceae bacterium]|jgi:3-phosphoshikimate 1-carboxyvinyltransferase
MTKVRVSKADQNAVGTIKLSGSKSISNRVLIIQALCEGSFEILNLSDSDDTKTLQALLSSDSYELDAHHAGTTFRFLTSYLATRTGENILTGSERMKERPIQALSDALIKMGADISYLNNEGYPPLKISAPTKRLDRKISVSADISSQYISSLLLVAPTLPNGLEITMLGDLVSRPYLEMTLKIMEYFGVSYTWNDHTITVASQKYKARDFFVEADWSAASYYYIIAAFAQVVDISLTGLQNDSLQGDSAIALIGNSFGLHTDYIDNSIRITKSGNSPEDFFEYDFLKCPDIAQSVSTMAAGAGVSALFTGLQTLRIKETDRIAALQTELAKVHIWLSKLPAKFSKKSDLEYYMQEGNIDGDEMAPTFATYKDHRMAMAFGPLAQLFTIEIEDHMVVTKSYPGYWEDLKSLGFEVELV